MARGGSKPAPQAPPRAQHASSKAQARDSKTDEKPGNLPLALQQRCLDIFRDALKPSQDDQAVLQEVKGHLFNRDFAAAFGKDKYLRVYASRWSPSRALAYLRIFEDIGAYLDPHTPSEDASLRVACLGGGAGGELVALAGRHSVRLDEAGEDAATRLQVALIDIAEWSGVTASLNRGLTLPPELSRYASQAKRDANRALIGSDLLAVEFQQQDVLSLDAKATAAFAEVVKKASLVTFMFTLNELYATSLAKTQSLLAQLTEFMTAGSCLLVVDSPGSYSTVSVNGAEKKYPMQWLLDHTLMGPPDARESTETQPSWRKVVSDDSRWFRLLETLQYPIDLENMRYQIHLYRKLGDVGG